MSDVDYYDYCICYIAISLYQYYSDRAREIQALRYMNDYLLDEVIKTKGYNGLEEYRIELKRMNNDIKK